MRLEAILFPVGVPRPPQLVEIVGESNTGKSLLLLELITRLILPTTCGGYAQEALLFDCENTYDQSILLALMEKCILNDAIPSLARTLDTQKIERIQRESLKRLHVHRCYSRREYEFNWHYLDAKLFSDYETIKYVMVDSIATFYSSKKFRKRDTSTRRIKKTRKPPIDIETYMWLRCKSLRRKAKKWGKTVFYTKPVSVLGDPYDMANESDDDLDPPELPEIPVRYDGIELSLANPPYSADDDVFLLDPPELPQFPVRYRIELSLANPPSSADHDEDDDDDPSYNAVITTRTNHRYERFYRIDDFGFNWIEQQEA